MNDNQPQSAANVNTRLTEENLKEVTNQVKAIRIETLKTQIEDLTTQKDQKTQKVTELTDRVKDLNREKAELISKLIQFEKEQTPQTESDYKDPETGKSLTPGEMVECLQDKNNSLKTELGEKNDEIKDIIIKRATAVQTLVDLKKDLRDKLQLVKQDLQNENIKSHISRKEENAAERELKFEGSPIDREVGIVQTLVGGAMDVCIELKNELGRNDEKFKDMRRNMSDKLEHIEELKQKISRLESLMNTEANQEDITRMRKEAEEKEKRYQQNMDRVMSAVAKMETEIRSTNTNETDGIKIKLKNKVSELENQVEALKVSKDILRSDCDAFCDKIWKVRGAKLSELTEVITKQESLIEELNKIRLKDEEPITKALATDPQFPLDGPEEKNKRYDVNTAKKCIEDGTSFLSKIKADQDSISDGVAALMRRTESTRDQIEELQMKIQSKNMKIDELKDLVDKYAPAEEIVESSTHSEDIESEETKRNRERKEQIEKVKNENLALRKENSLLQKKLNNYRREINRLLKENVLAQSAINVSVLDNIKRDVEEGLVLKPGEEFLDPAYVQNEMYTKEEYNRLDAEIAQRDAAIENLLRANDELETKFKKLNFKRVQLEKDKDHLAVFYKYLKSKAHELETHASRFDALVQENKKLKRMHDDTYFQVVADLKESDRLAKDNNKNVYDLENEIQQALMSAKMDPDFDPEEFGTNNSPEDDDEKGLATIPEDGTAVPKKKKKKKRREPKNLMNVQYDGKKVNLDDEILKQLNSTYLENAELRKKIEQKGKYVIQLNNDLKQFKNRAKQLIKLEDTIIALVSENKSLREALQITRTSLSTEAEQHSVENQKIREEFEGLLRSFDKLIEENRKKKNKIEQLKVKQALLEKTISGLKTDNSGLKERNNELTTRNEGISKEKNDLEVKNGGIPKLEERIEELKGEVSDLENTNRILNSNLTKKSGGAGLQLKSRLEEIEELKNENRSHEKKISELKRELRTKDSEIKDLKVQLLDKQKEIGRLDKGKTEVKGEVATLVAVRAEDKKLKIRLDDQVNQLQQEIRRVNEDKKQLEKSVDRLTFELEQKRKELGQSTEQHRLRIKGELEGEYGKRLLELQKQLTEKELNLDREHQKFDQLEKENYDLEKKLKHKNRVLIDFNKFMMNSIRKARKQEGNEDQDQTYELAKRKLQKDQEDDKADDIAELINHNKRMLNDLEMYKEKFERVSEDYEHMKGRYEDSNKKKEAAIKELIQKTNLYNEYAEQIILYRHQLDSHKKDITDLKDDKHYLESQLNESRKENLKLYELQLQETSLHTTSVCHKANFNNNRVLKGSGSGESDPRNEIGKIRDNLNKKIDENRGLLKRITTLEKEKSNWHQKGFTRSRKEVNESDYQTVDPEMRKSLGTFPEQVELGEAIIAQGGEVGRLEKKLEQVRDHNKDLKKLLQAKESELDRVEKSYKRLREEMDEMDKLRKEGDQSSLEMDEKVSGLRKILGERNSQIEELEGDMRALKKKENASQVKVRDYESEVRLLKMNVESSEAQKSTLEAEMDQMKDKIKVLGGSLE